MTSVSMFVLYPLCFDDHFENLKPRSLNPHARYCLASICLKNFVVPFQITPFVVEILSIEMDIGGLEV